MDANMDFELPELDRKETKKRVEEHLAKYRLYKYLTFEEREPCVTSSPEPRYHGKTNKTTSQTEEVAIFNADQQQYRKQFCERTERAVKHLPPMERFLIEQRYMTPDSEYITDYHVYCHLFKPPISAPTYAKIRWKAFYRLALNLNLAVIKETKANE